MIKRIFFQALALSSVVCLAIPAYSITQNEKAAKLKELFESSNKSFPIYENIMKGSDPKSPFFECEFKGEPVSSIGFANVSVTSKATGKLNQFIVTWIPSEFKPLHLEANGKDSPDSKPLDLDNLFRLHPEIGEGLDYSCPYGTQMKDTYQTVKTSHSAPEGQYIETSSTCNDGRKKTTYFKSFDNDKYLLVKETISSLTEEKNSYGYCRVSSTTPRLYESTYKCALLDRSGREYKGKGKTEEEAIQNAVKTCFEKNDDYDGHLICDEEIMLEASCYPL